jgi:hypothetical protein
MDPPSPSRARSWPGKLRVTDDAPEIIQNDSAVVTYGSEELRCVRLRSKGLVYIVTSFRPNGLELKYVSILTLTAAYRENFPRPAEVLE